MMGYLRGRGMGDCRVDYCESQGERRGMCARHYTRWRRYGDPEYRMFVPQNGTPRISDVMARSEPITETGCWIWTGQQHQKDGYGMWKCAGEWLAHRVSYIVANGAIPDGLCVCHTCDVRECVNPDHLWAGTNDENMADMKNKGRAVCGERHHSAKLTADNVRDIRDSDMRPSTAAKKYGISHTAAQRVIDKVTWRHI